MTELGDQMIALHDALDRAALPHAFGGALALAWCTERARGTIDIDLNVFVPAADAPVVLGALPDGIDWSVADRELVQRDGQVRLWWDGTPVDLFLNTTEFHEQAAARAHWRLFSGWQLPFLSCPDLAVFKAFFNRTKDWADLEEMAAAGSLDVARVVGVISEYLGGSDERVERLRSLARG